MNTILFPVRSWTPDNLSPNIRHYLRIKSYYIYRALQWQFFCSRSPTAGTRGSNHRPTWSYFGQGNSRGDGELVFLLKSYTVKVACVMSSIVALLDKTVIVCPLVAVLKICYHTILYHSFVYDCCYCSSIQRRRWRVITLLNLIHNGLIIFYDIT